MSLARPVKIYFCHWRKHAYKRLPYLACLLSTKVLSTLNNAQQHATLTNPAFRHCDNLRQWFQMRATSSVRMSMIKRWIFCAGRLIISACWTVRFNRSAKTRSKIEKKNEQVAWVNSTQLRDWNKMTAILVTILYTIQIFDFWKNAFSVYFLPSKSIMLSTWTMVDQSFHIEHSP